MSATLQAHAERIAGGFPRTFWVLWWGTFINRLGLFVVPFMAVYLTNGRHFPVATAGLVASLWGVGGVLASQVGGYLADHLGRRRTMLMGLGLGGLSMITLGFVSELRWILPLTFLTALLSESYRPGMQACIADIIPAHDRARAFGVLYWVINLGVSFGLVLGGVLATKSYLYLFLGDGLSSIAFAFLIWRYVPETLPRHAPGAQAEAAPKPGFVGGVLAPYRDRPFLVFILLSVATLIVFLQHAAAMPVDITSHGISNLALGWILAVNGIVIVLVQPFASPWLTRLHRSRVLAAGALLMGVGFGMNRFASTPWMYALASTVWTLGEIAVLPIANAVVADVALPSMRGRYQGAYGLSWGIAGFLAPLIGTGVMQRFGAHTLWWACLVTGVAVALGQLALSPALTRLRRERSAAS